jgi:hypothetical protein
MVTDQTTFPPSGTRIKAIGFGWTSSPPRLYKQVTLMPADDFKGFWYPPDGGGGAPVRFRLDDEVLLVTGRFFANRQPPIAFAYPDIVRAQRARVVMEPGVACHLRDGTTCWFYWPIFYPRAFSRCRKLLNALAARGVSTPDGVSRMGYWASTRAGQWSTRRRDSNGNP